MIGLPELSIGLGLAISLLFTELFGLAAGGMVVPGYVALSMNEPLSVVVTLGLGLATFLVVRMIATVTIVYGRRRTVLMILVGFLLGAAVRSFQGTVGTGPLAELHVIGYIIPGLIAIWIDRQGLLETLTSLLTAAVTVRLMLILFVGAELLK